MKYHLSQLKTGKRTGQLNLKMDFIKDLHISYKKLCEVRGHHDSERQGTDSPNKVYLQVYHPD
jgi:hypothetical protein